MKNADYWKIRFGVLEEASNKYGLETYMQIEPAFDSAQRKIQKEIEAWYGRYARNNGITMQEARKILSTKELKEFRWDVNEYIKRGRENAVSQQWVKELENASARVHVSRLEALKIRTQQFAEVAFGNELDCIDAMARKVFTEDYYHSIFELQKGFGIGWEIGQIDPKKLDKFIKKPWALDGKHFSERIWQQRGQLVSEIHQQLTRTCILGKAPDDAIKAISKKFGTTKSNAGRLVMTEQAYFHSVAQQEAFTDLDVEEFEIVATLDAETSEICQEMDGKHFPMSTYEAGVTAPPFHPWCRSVTVPYFEDNFTGERAARNADGETYYVPDSMTYKEWKKGMVDGDTKRLTKANSCDKKDAIADVARGTESISDLLAKCKNTEEVSTTVQEYFRNKGSKIKTVDFGKADFDAAKEMAEMLDSLDDQYASSLSSVRVKRMPSHLGGSATPTKESFEKYVQTGDPSVLEIEMELNEDFLKSKEAIMREFKNARRSKNGGVSNLAMTDERYAAVSSMVHEYGHTLCPGNANEVYQKLTGSFNPNYMPFRRQYNMYMRELRDKQRKIQEVRDSFAGQTNGLQLGIEAAKDLQDELDAMCISRYSKESVGEFIAEAFCNAMLSSNPKQASAKVLETIKKLFGKGG